MENGNQESRKPGAPMLKKKPLFPLLFQLILVAGFLGLATFSFGQNVLSWQKPADVPASLGKMEMVSNFKGSEALAQVNKLHGADIRLAEASILQYAHKDPYHNENEKVTVWIGKAETAAAASELLERMTSGILKGGSGFRNLQKLSVGGQEILKVDGPGGNHYFYIPKSSQDKVIWLAIQNAKDNAVLEMAVKAFQG